MTPTVEPTDVVCSAADLEAYTTYVLEAVGLSSVDAQYMAGQIVGSDLAGHESHGMRRLAEYVAQVQTGTAAPASTSSVDIDRGSLVRLNGNRGFGHTVLRDATRLAVDRARSHGIAGIAVYNSQFAGRISFFCEEAADAGVATLFFVNDSGSGHDVAPPGGTDGRISTNPIAAGVPRAKAPHLVLDIATSTVAMGRLSEWRDRGEVIPDEWVTPTGVLKPFGGFKGFGLALVAEALAGALTSAGTVSEAPSEELQGVFLIAIDVAPLRCLDEFTGEVDAFISYVKSSPCAPGEGPVRVPGEGSARTTTARRRTGVAVKAFTWREILRMADQFGVTPPVNRIVGGSNRTDRDTQTEVNSNS